MRITPNGEYRKIKMMDKNSIKIVDLHSKENDFAFWKTQLVEKRLEALEELRIQFMIWKYGAEQGFQRVYRIIKRSQDY